MSQHHHHHSKASSNHHHNQQSSASKSSTASTSSDQQHHSHGTTSTQLKFVFTYQNQQIVIYDKQIRSLIFWIVLIGIHLIVLSVVYIRQQVPNFSIDNNLPLSEFSSRRCIDEAKQFYATPRDGECFGRIVGSDEYRKSLQFLGKKLSTLKAKNDKSNPGIEMSIDFHYVKDGQAIFSRKHLDSSKKIILSYSNVTNILVRLHSKKHVHFLNESILVSSHFDSVPSTQSVSGTIPTFIALEMISNLIHDPVSIHHPVIFMFNSAKEIGMIGSKIFATRHPWASSVRSVINMESIGSGASRDLTFQSSNTWIMKQFASVCKYPKATSVAQDFFSLGLIPSQSDFNVYQSYLNLTIGGIDSVFYRNGYVHHTNRDTFDKLNSNTLQHMGENLTPFIKKLASFNSYFPNVNNTSPEDPVYEEITAPAVYFDVLSLYIYCYSSISASPVHYVIILIAFTFMVRKIYVKEAEKLENKKKRRRKQSLSNEKVENVEEEPHVEENERYLYSLSKAFGIVLLSLISSLVFPSLVALTLTYLFKNPMSWYATGPVFTLFLFALPSILGMAFVLSVFSRYTSSFYIYVAVWLFWVLVTLVFNYFNIVSTFLPVVVVLALVIASSHTIQKYTKWWIHITIMMAGYLIFVLEHILIAVNIFVPIMSRSGFVNEIWKCDVTIACLIGFIAFLGTNLLYPYIVSENQRKAQIADSTKLPLFIFLGASLLLMFVAGIFLSAYSESAPKRVLIQKVVVLPEDHFEESFSFGVRKGSSNLQLSDIEETTESDHSTQFSDTQRTYISFLHTDSVPVTYVMNDLFKNDNVTITNSEKNEIYLIPALAIQQVTSLDYNSFSCVTLNEENSENNYFRNNPVKMLTFGSRNNITIILESDILVLSQEIRIYLKPEHILDSSIENMQQGDYLTFFHLYASSRGDFSKILKFFIHLNDNAPRQFTIQVISHYTHSENTKKLFKSEFGSYISNLPKFISPIYTLVTDTKKTIKIRS
ncbi:predicted protein [Naegleria gruberi]|uniref:Predicted protein n=1 Tax=Naegleria gruberi TaxID=5762 RepID=D2V378_NAEGR|nr:uncharacterized protein NAEGRDRAFT_63258 [Naegleria gruberi]EFC48727.1 predicted protein [Naegleria gruberi]|eukprot:XP_002681471.1 predicted protein [Naegleria gruberi strain NEG-M]